jgi:hypothetical protein
MPDYIAAVPSSADVARDLLPGVRLAARERYGRGVRMALLAPFLPFLLQVFLQFVLPYIIEWLTKQSAPPVADALPALAKAWERERLPEVAIAMHAVARGETGL